MNSVDHEMSEEVRFWGMKGAYEPFIPQNRIFFHELLKLEAYLLDKTTCKGEIFIKKGLQNNNGGVT